MEKTHSPVRRRVKIVFRGSKEEFVGTIVYSGTEFEIGKDELRVSNFKFISDLGDEHLFDYWKIDIAHYL